MLSAAILDQSGTALELLRQCPRDSFYSDSHRAIYDSMLALDAAASVIDVSTLANQLRADGKWALVGGVALAQLLDETPATPHIENHVAIVRDLHRLRQSLVLAQSIGAEARLMRGADPERVRQFVESNEQRFAELAQEQRLDALVPLGEILIGVTHQLGVAYEAQSPIVGVPLGFRKLDHLLTGLHDGDSTIVAGRPGQGKSAFAGSTALYQAGLGYAVPLFSMEMPAAQIALRMVAIESGLDLNLLRTGRFEAQHWDTITAAIERLSQLPIWINDTPGLTPQEVRACLRALQRDVTAGRYESVTQGRLGAVLIDYLQLMRGNSTRDRYSREEEIGSISRDLKRLAKELGLPIVALAQLNREVEKRPDHRPRLSDLRESGSIEQDADNVLFLHRPEYYDPKDESLRGWAEVIVAKQRNGRTGDVFVQYIPEHYRFTEIPTEVVNENPS